MGKNFLISILLVSIIILTACTSQSNKAKEANVKANEQQIAASDTLVIDGLKIKVKRQEINQKVVDGKKREVITFKITGKNMASVNKGLGTIDFILKTKDGKEVEADSSMATFGDEIKPGATIEGTTSFELKADQQAAKLVYKRTDKELAEWDVEAK